MQTFCRFIFHSCTKSVPLDVTRRQRTKENEDARQYCDQEKDHNGSRVNQQSSSQDRIRLACTTGKQF